MLAKCLCLLSCLALFEVRGNQPSRSLTKSPTGCACWWDLEQALTDPKTGKPFSCACCRPGGHQCGYPQHNWCTKESSSVGCRQVTQYRYTLSEIGHPCHWDPSRRDCAWCNYNGFQCSNATTVPNSQYKPGRYCKKFLHNHHQCLGTSQDCRNNEQECDPNATCVDTKKGVSGGWTRWSCACNPGFVGNGITCINKQTGKVTARIPSKIDLDLTLTTEFTSIPDGPVPAGVLGPSAENLFDEMNNMLDTGVLCPGCNSVVASCDA